MNRHGQIPLRVAIMLSAGVLVGLCVWTYRASRVTRADGRQEIVCWGITYFGDDVYSLVHRFEEANPRYKVIVSSSVERDVSSDGQRLLSAVAGGVPPDVVFFPRHATGEWASRGALADLRPMIERQEANDPHAIRLEEYYDWALAESSYTPPGSKGGSQLCGIPVTADIRVLYVNSNILRQAELVDGRREPRIPRNWDELRNYANRLTLYRDPAHKRNITRLGFAPNFGNSWLYMYAWQAGGEMLSADRTKITMDSPAVVRALRFMTSIYDDLGGIAQVNAFQQNFQGGTSLDPFIAGQVAMKIDNDYALRNIADYRPEMDFVIAPAPMPGDEVAKGREPVTWAGGYALVIPATSRNREGAFELIQYLTSWQAVQLLEQGKREQKQSEGRLYLPEGLGNRAFFQRLMKDAIFDNPRVPVRFKEAYGVLEELMPHTRYRPVTPVGQLLWNQHVAAYEAAVNHAFAEEARRTGQDEVKLALSTMQGEVQRQLDEALRPAPMRKVNWTPYAIGYALVCVAPFVLIWWVYQRRRREYGYRAREVMAGMMFISPWLVGMIVLTAGPILFSIVLSFTRYDVLSPARYVGLENFRTIFSDRIFYQSLSNTAFMILRIPLMMTLSLAIALMLNRSVRGIGFYRTAFYMPAIVPLVASSLLWIWLLNPGNGIINNSLNWVFDTRGFEWVESMIGRQITPPLWLQDPRWSKPALILMNLWTAGAGMIIWLAGLQSVPPQLYEAASIDGASAWRRFWHITMPMLSPYILFNLIIGLIATMQIFGEAYIMTAGGPDGSTLFYAYHLFRQAFQYFRMGYASALAWILFVIVLVLTLMQLWVSRRWVHYERT